MITANEILDTKEFTKAVRLPDGSIVRGVFENQSADPLGINTVAPNVALSSEVADTLREGDRLLIDSTHWYTVREKEHDDEGLTIVNLGASS